VYGQKFVRLHLRFSGGDDEERRTITIAILGRERRTPGLRPRDRHQELQADRPARPPLQARDRSCNLAALFVNDMRRGCSNLNLKP
jgi:hypothetical protein